MRVKTLLLTALAAMLLSGCGALGFLGYRQSAPAQKAGPPKLKDKLNDLASIECPTLRQMVDAARKDYYTDDNVFEGNVASETYGKVVVALARCGESKLIFEDIAHLNGSRVPGYGASVLLAADEQSSGAVFTLFQQYAKANAGSAFLPKNVFAARHIGKWLLRTNRKDQCDLIGTATAGASDDTVGGFRDYFIEAKCPQATAVLVEQLSSTDPEVRSVACAQLASVGDKSVLEKVEFLAKNDRTFKFGERHSDGKLERDANGRPAREYFVAYSCQIAAELIRQRTK